MEGSTVDQQMCEQDGAAERGFYGLTVTPIPIALSCLGGEESESEAEPGVGWGVVLIFGFISYHPIVNKLN